MVGGGWVSRNGADDLLLVAAKAESANYESGNDPEEGWTRPGFILDPLEGNIEAGPQARMTITAARPTLTILILAPLFPDTLLDDFKATLPAHWNVLYFPERSGASHDVLHGSASDGHGGQVPTPAQLAQVNVLFGFSIPASILPSLKQAPRLSLVQLASSGSDHVLSTPFFKSLPAESPVIIASAAGIHAVPIAEHVFATLLGQNHHVPRWVLASRVEGKWEPASHKELGDGRWAVHTLRGRTMGLIGYGHIAREVARMAVAMGMRVVTATRSGIRALIGGYTLPGTGDHEGCFPEHWYSTSSREAMATFYGACDVVVNVLPSTPSTRGFVDASSFAAMKPSAIFVNVGRGDTIDEGALVDALQSGRLRGASLDVAAVEPLPDRHVLLSLPNAIVTPHVSGMSERYHVDALELLRINVQRVCEDGLGALNAVHGRGEGPGP